MVEHRGFEPLTSTLPVLRAPNCANAPFPIYYTEKRQTCQGVFAKKKNAFEKYARRLYKYTHLWENELATHLNNPDIKAYYR